MVVTSVKIYPIRNNASMVALADIVLDGGLALSELRIIQQYGDHLVIQYPISQHSSTTKIRHICNPINRETQRIIEEAVLDAYRKAKEYTNEKTE